MRWDFKSFHFIKNQHILLLASKTPSLTLELEKLKIYMTSWVWWCPSVIPPQRSLEQEEF